MTRHGEMMTLMMRFDDIKYWMSNFIEDWIYPAYSIRNGLFLRYDTVRMPQLRRTDYHEPCERMYYANMELVRHFVEKNDWQRFQWYDEKDDDGELQKGIRYGMSPDKRVYLPEYKGKYVIDIIKEITSVPINLR